MSYVVLYMLAVFPFAVLIFMYFGIGQLYLILPKHRKGEDHCGGCGTWEIPPDLPVLVFPSCGAGVVCAGDRVAAWGT